VIGVRANPGEEDVVREFFELFKTPWEFSTGGRAYDVCLSTTGEPTESNTAKVTIIYCATAVAFDATARIAPAAEPASAVVEYGSTRLPLYGAVATFDHAGIGLMTVAQPPRAVAYARRTEGGLVVRVGYDLFGEIRIALTEGQPAANAGIPTLELHIALLRELIAWSGLPLVEVPPIPEGYPFIACLTHDVDHPSIRRHGWDHTTLGFLVRACLGSVVALCRGRATLGDLVTNWAAAARWPLVHLGLARDFWSDLRQYVAIDRGAPSTFFVIPRANQAGQTSDGEAPSRRAARYGARDIADEIHRLVHAGCEVGVHGIDAWLDDARGREELAEISAITGASEVGVRMHWLYFSEKSPAILEQAGFSYDSTNGYNETVGYRAGTTQVFQPLGTTSLLELPLHVMDTALFFPRHLDLSPREARKAVGAIVDSALRLGGIVTVNWHDRSIAPERLWGRVYRDVVDDFAAQGAWFATAAETVSWFRKRRATVFERVSWSPESVSVRVSVGATDRLPGLRLRVHEARAHRVDVKVGCGPAAPYRDIGVRHTLDACIPR
jgi:hypothetical protein